MSKPRAVVLLSSGLDSTANLLMAREEFEVVLALTFDYGQRAAAAEIRQSQLICEKYNIPSHVVELPFFKYFTKTSLLDRSKEVPTGKEVQIDNHNQSLQTKTKVWVPNRNGIFLNVAAGFAEGLRAPIIVPGYNKEEAETFPDNSLEFLERSNEVFKLSTEFGVRAHCFTIDMMKAQIVKELTKRKFDLGLLWPCYHNGEKICGVCESCLRFERALSLQ